MRKLYHYALTAAAIVAAASAFGASAADIYVKEGASGSGASASDAKGNIADAVASAAEGDVVKVLPGNYTLAATLKIPAGVTLAGESAGAARPVITIDAEATGAILELEAGEAGKFASAKNLIVTGAKSGRGITANKYAYIYGCDITNNTTMADETTTGGDGAGVWMDAYSTLENCKVTGNEAKKYVCGGVSIYGKNVTLKNCLVAKNISTGKQTGKGFSVGGILIWPMKSTFDCINSPEEKVTDVKLINVTMAQNTGVSIGGAWMDVNSTSKWYNCVTWDCRKTDGTQSALSVKNTHEFFNYYGNHTSNIITITKILANSNTEDNGEKPAPRFADPASGDYTLLADSPMVDAGSDDYYGPTVASDKDLAGNARKSGESIDAGAYEYNPDSSSVAAIAADETDAAPEYYNLQGMRISESVLLKGGIYIMVRGNKASKIYR